MNFITNNEWKFVMNAWLSFQGTFQTIQMHILLLTFKKEYALPIHILWTSLKYYKWPTLVITQLYCSKPKDLGQFSHCNMRAPYPIQFFHIQHFGKAIWWNVYYVYYFVPFFETPCIFIFCFSPLYLTSIMVNFLF
jgi:hypothetical protein